MTKKATTRNPKRTAPAINALRCYELACDVAREARAQWGRLTLDAVTNNTGEAWEAAHIAERQMAFRSADERAAENFLTDLATMARNATGRASTMRGAIELRHEREEKTWLEQREEESWLEPPAERALNNGAASMRGKE